MSVQKLYRWHLLASCSIFYFIPVTALRLRLLSERRSALLHKTRPFALSLPRYGTVPKRPSPGPSVLGRLLSDSRHLRDDDMYRSARDTRPQVALDVSVALADFLPAATTYAHERCWGSLTATGTVPPPVFAFQASLCRPSDLSSFPSY